MATVPQRRPARNSFPQVNQFVQPTGSADPDADAKNHARENSIQAGLFAGGGLDPGESRLVGAVVNLAAGADVVRLDTDRFSARERIALHLRCSVSTVRRLSPALDRLARNGVPLVRETSRGEFNLTLYNETRRNLVSRTPDDATGPEITAAATILVARIAGKPVLGAGARPRRASVTIYDDAGEAARRRFKTALEHERQDLPNERKIEALLSFAEALRGLCLAQLGRDESAIFADSDPEPDPDPDPGDDLESAIFADSDPDLGPDPDPESANFADSLPDPEPVDNLESASVLKEEEEENHSLCPAEPLVAPVEPPPELLDLRQWVCWRYEPREGQKPAKVPIDPITGDRARVNDDRTWTGYDRARARYDAGGYDGLGFVLTKETGIVVVDLDGCRDPETGDLDEWAARIVARLDTFAEISPSGTGCHLWTRGTLDGRTGRRRGQIEMYASGRFIAWTGVLVAGSPDAIHERTDELHELHRSVFGPEPEPTPLNGTPPVILRTDLDDDEVLHRAQLDGKGARFNRLWAGDITGYPSASEADLALVGMLKQWTRDRAQLDTLFRASGLYRPKWDEPHRADGRTYGELTIDEALDGRGQHDRR